MSILKSSIQKNCVICGSTGSYLRFRYCRSNVPIVVHYCDECEGETAGLHEMFINKQFMYVWDAYHVKIRLYEMRESQRSENLQVDERKKR